MIMRPVVKYCKVLWFMTFKSDGADITAPLCLWLRAVTCTVLTYLPTIYRSYLNGIQMISEKEKNVEKCACLCPELFWSQLIRRNDKDYHVLHFTSRGGVDCSGTLLIYV